MMREHILIVVSALLLAGLHGAWSQDLGPCPNGYTGPQCAVCLDDVACAVSTDNAGATCNKSFKYSNTSVVKSLSCNPNSPALILNLLEPDSMLLQCYTGLTAGPSGAVAPIVEGAPPPEEFTFGAPTVAPGPSAESPQGDGGPSLQQLASQLFSNVTGSLGNLIGRRRLQQEGEGEQVEASGATPHCDISFMVQDPRVLVKCKADGCFMKVGSALVTCQTTSCACDGDPGCGDSALTSSLVSSVNGYSEINCEDSGSCTFKLGGLPLSSIGAQCTAGECLVPYTENGTSGTIPGENSTDTNQGSKPVAMGVSNLKINPIIAAIPAILLTCIVLFFGTYTFTRRALWQNRPVPSLGGNVTKAPSIGNKVKQLEFSNVTVTVPMAKQTVEKKQAALRNKALIRHGTMHTLRHDDSLMHKLQKGARERLGLKTSDDVELPATTSEDMANAAEYVVKLHDGGDPGTWCILRNCSGVASAGHVIGVLGPSGCGKTTLLSAITGSASDLGGGTVLQGSVLVDGAPRKEREVAYVPQADYFIPTLTVQECIRYSALLRLPQDTSPAEIQLRVDYVLHELGLRHIADSQVGGSGHIRGISGGERRRVTIGMELVIDPAILVLDEPTSGLDSYTAINLVRSLRQVAAGGRVVIASLHQPSKDMFFALDQVILMGHGRMLFMGKPEEAEGALAAAGVPCPPGTAVAEHMLKVASNADDIVAMMRARAKEAAAGSRVGGAAPGKVEVVTAMPSPGTRPVSAASETSYTSGSTPNGKPALSPEVGGVAEAHFNASDGRYLPSTSDDGTQSSAVAAPSSRKQISEACSGFTRQMAVMFWRTSVDILRNPTLLALHVAISTIVGVIVGAMFFDLDDSSVGVQNRMGGTFFALAFLAFTSLTTVDLLMNERSVVMREVRSGYYRPTSYLLSKLALDGMLLRVLPAILFWLPFYYMAGFRSGAAYASTYLFTLIAFNCAVGALSMAVTVVCSTAGQSSFVMNFILLFSLAFTGFLVNVSSIPVVLRWIHYLSVFYYAFEAMLTNELNGSTFDFEYRTSPNSPPVLIPDIAGETFLSSLGFDTTRTTVDIGILVAMYAGFVLFALLLFLWRTQGVTVVRRIRKSPAVPTGASVQPVKS